MTVSNLPLSLTTLVLTRTSTPSSPSRRATGATKVEGNAGSNLSAADGTARILANPLQFRQDGAALGHAIDNGQLTFNGAVNLYGSNRTFSILSPVVFAGLIGDNPKVPTSTTPGSGNFTKLGSASLTITRDAATVSPGTSRMANRISAASPSPKGS